ncbi:MAG: hypothetical protein ABIY70_11990 [Capsulimonas sp.]|uniref:hypothetical protein n=1 Tax=Capsulimonas sp. TaxID=2494211 RepID=UPI0032635D7C
MNFRVSYIASPKIEPKAGDLLLFVRPHRLFDYVIKLLMWTPYYHVGLYTGDNSVLEARPWGVAINTLQGREDWFVVAPAPEGKGPEALAWAKTQIGARFDRWNMLHVLLEHLSIKVPMTSLPSGKYSCGEFVATAFYHAGVRLFPNEDLDDVAPKDFARFLPKDNSARPRV